MGGFCPTLRAARCRQPVGDGRLAVVDFHVRYEYWALFEGWADVPDSVRRALNKWELDAYVASQADTVAALKGGHPRRVDQVCPEYVLLDEAEALLCRVDRIYLWPCNCRVMVGGCSRPTLTCLRFDNARDIGWEVSRTRAIAIVRDANKRGLMQSAELALDAGGRFKSQSFRDGVPTRMGGTRSGSENLDMQKEHLCLRRAQK